MNDGAGWLRRIRARIRARGFATRVVQLIWLAILFVELAVALHVLLKVAGAMKAGFTNFVDGVSAPFVGPFHPVFKDQIVNGNPLEVGTLLGMAVYAILAFAAIRIVRGIASPGGV